LLRAAIDQITDKDHDSIRMAPGATAIAVSEMREQCRQLVELPMNIADDVNGQRHGSCLTASAAESIRWTCLN